MINKIFNFFFLFLLLLNIYSEKSYSQNKNSSQDLKNSVIFNDGIKLYRNGFSSKINAIHGLTMNEINISKVNAWMLDLEKTNDKIMLYEKQKKDPATALFLSFLLSSTGHLYAGNWPRGLLFTLARISWVILVFGEKNNPYHGYVISVGIAFIAIPEMIDAVNETKRYNKRLWQKINSESISLGIKILPSNNAVMLRCSKNF